MYYITQQGYERFKFLLITEKGRLGKIFIQNKSKDRCLHQVSVCLDMLRLRLSGEAEGSLPTGNDDVSPEADGR